MSSTHVSGGVSTPPCEQTCIGVDVGLTRAFTAAPAGGAAEDAFTISGSAIREAVDDLTTAQRRLCDVQFTTERSACEAFAAGWLYVRSKIIETAVRTVRYAEQFPDPVLVVEHFSSDGPSLWEWRTRDDAHDAWILPTLLEALELHADQSGIRVETVNRHGTSQECHVCGSGGELSAHTLRCSAPSCPVEEVCRDRSAALTIADRGQRQLTE